MSFKKGDIIQVFKKLNDWWAGLNINNKEKGYFPSNFIEEINN